jgi:ParB family chromosome partitioning protein
MTAPVTPLYHPNLPLSVIVESAHNPRKRYDAASLLELAETIRTRGIHNPVLVREIETPAGTRFELAAGHRRCRAARLVGLVEVPALIMTLTDEAFLELLHLDNLQRDDVDPLDEAAGYEQLLERGYDVARLADKIGKSITYVASRVRLLALGVAAREAMRLGYVKLSHALELAKLPEGVQEQLLDTQWNLSPVALARAASGEHAAGSDDDQDHTSDAPEQGEAEDNAVADEALSEEFPAPKATDGHLRARSWGDIEEPTVFALKRAIALDVYRKLSVVPWALDDATLVPEAGACATCSKRSSHAPLLFAELDREDACLDASCYAAKGDAYHERQYQLSAAGPANHTPRDQPDTPTARVAAPDARTREAERAQREQTAEACQRGRDAAVRAVLAAVPGKAFGQLPWLRALLTLFLEQVHGETLDRILALMKLDTTRPDGESEFVDTWKEERIYAWANDPRRTPRQLVRAVLLAALGPELLVNPWDVERMPETLAQFASLAEVDIADAAAQAMADAATVPVAPPAASARARRRGARSIPSTTGVQ